MASLSFISLVLVLVPCMVQGLVPHYMAMSQKQDLGMIQYTGNEIFTTKMINIRHTTVHVSSVATITATHYMTCTRVLPDTPHCHTLTPVTDKSPELAATSIPTQQQDQVTDILNVPVLLPSCNCPEEDIPQQLSRRSPKFLRNDVPTPLIVITKTSTLLSTTTHTVTNTDTTVAIIYGGCVPVDAVTTVACVGTI